MKDIVSYLDTVGAVKSTDSITKRDKWVLATTAGDLNIIPRDEIIFSRFEEPEKANEFNLGTNPHSGKWNHYGVDGLETFKSMLDELLVDDGPDNVSEMVSESAQYMCEEEGDSMEYYIKWSSHFDAPQNKYDLETFKVTLKGLGAEVWEDNQYGWSNQPRVAMFKGITPEAAENELGKLAVFSKWPPIIGEVDVDWDEAEEDE